MTLIDFIKNFVEYEIGDFVVYGNEKIFLIDGAPKFALYDSDGFSGHVTDYICDLKRIHFTRGAIPVGYSVIYVDSENNLSEQYHQLCTLYEKYDSEKHVHLQNEMTKFQKLLEIERLKDEIEELDEM